MLTKFQGRFEPPLAIALVAVVCLTSTPAAAYMGPGAGLTAIGTVLAVIAALLLALVGFVWYPLKRILRIGRGNKAATAESDEAAGAPASTVAAPPPDAGS